MVVETRIRTAPGTTIRFNVLGLGEERAGLSSVHLRCTVTLEHATRRLHGSGLVLPDRVKPDFRQQQQPSTSDEVRDLRDPSILLRPDDVLRAVLDMLASAPRLRGVDLSDPAAWDGEYAPRRVAGWLHEQGSRWLAGPERERRRCRFDVDARLKVTLVFSEPRAVLRRCAEVAMQTVAPGSDEECRICLDEFRNGGKSGPVNLPCGHAFHAHCMLTWLDRGTNCPACRHDLTGMVAAPWAAPTRMPWVAPTTWAAPTPAPASSSTTTARWRGSRARGRR